MSGSIYSFVVPAKAGTQWLCSTVQALGSGIRRNDENEVIAG